VTGVVSSAIVGAWQLRSYEIERAPGVVIDRPFGSAPHGMLIYTADGWVAVHAMADDRRRCGTRRPIECSATAKVAAYDSYFGYSGRWSLAGDVITHHVVTSCFPDWTGTDLRRQVWVRGDAMTLRGTEPDGPEARIPLLRWERCAAA
jgi:Lipocalin-like domain